MSMTEAMTEILERLRKQDDRTEIVELTARYAWHVARAEPKELVALFAPDGVYDTPQDRRQGHAELMDYFTKLLEPDKIVPMVQSHIVEINGDNATAVLKMHSPWLGDKPGFCGYYHDTYRRVDGRWRFVLRKWARHVRPGSA